MLDFSTFLPLPFIWGAIIALAVFLYVLLDGFDLGVGILFPYAPTHQDRGQMMVSIAPFWDANETWLVLGGGGLYGTFPMAYGILMPAFYLPIIFMLISLIFRGVAFEFRFKGNPTHQKLWDVVFHVGSFLAAFFQGLILGGFLQGIKVEGTQFAGGPFDWFTPFSVLTGICVIIAYALLGATWTVMKTEGALQVWAKKASEYLLYGVLFAMVLVTLWMVASNMEIKDRLFNFAVIEDLFFVPVLVALCASALWYEVRKKPTQIKYDLLPFFAAIGLFIAGFMGLAGSLWPFIIPFTLDFREAAASAEALSLLLVGMVVMLPVVLCYSGYVYYIFRGKVQPGDHY